MADLRDCIGPGELDQAALNVMNLLAWYLMPRNGKGPAVSLPPLSVDPLTPPRGEEEVYGDVPLVPVGLIGVGGG